MATNRGLATWRMHCICFNLRNVVVVGGSVFLVVGAGVAGRRGGGGGAGAELLAPQLFTKNSSLLLEIYDNRFYNG